MAGAAREHALARVGGAEFVDQMDRVRGWGRMRYLPDSEALYEETGRAIAEAMSIGWREMNRGPDVPEERERGRQRKRKERDR